MFVHHLYSHHWLATFQSGGFLHKLQKLNWCLTVNTEKGSLDSSLAEPPIQKLFLGLKDKIARKYTKIFSFAKQIALDGNKRQLLHKEYGQS